MAATCGRNGIRLAVNILTNHFGELVSKVCECLLRRGSLTIPEIVRFAEVTASNVRKALLILIQHNCVQAFSAPRGKGDNTVTYYIAIFDGILNRMRFPKFMSVVKDDLSEEAKELLEGILQNGRLTFDQIVDRRAAKYKGSARSRNQSCSQELSRHQLRAILNELVHAHYVERCPRPEPFVDPALQEQAASSKRRRSSEFERPVSLQEQVISVALPVDAERFLDIPESAIIVDDGHKAATLKRKYDDNQDHSEVTENEILWRANYEKFLFCLKKKACIVRVRSRLGLDAGTVLEAIIDLSGKERLKDSNCVSASISNIYGRIQENPGSNAMMMEHIKVTLEQIGNCLIPDNPTAQSTLDLSSIIEESQMSEIEALMRARYGQDGYRIFRVLAKSGKQAQTETIAALTILEDKIVLETLWKMFKDGYVRSDRLVKEDQGQKHVWLWRIEKNTLKGHILDTMYHAALNLEQKIARIIEQQHEYERDTEKLRQTMTRRYILSASLQKLDDAMMIFNDF